jgi:cephalosporin hydroxylase
MIEQEAKQALQSALDDCKNTTWQGCNEWQKIMLFQKITLELEKRDPQLLIEILKGLKNE